MTVDRPTDLFFLFSIGSFSSILGGFIMLFLNREGGQGLAEYALLITFIALAVVLVVAVFGQELRKLFLTITNTLDPYFS